jgi:hypothetical protein
MFSLTFFHPLSIRFLVVNCFHLLTNSRLKINKNELKKVQRFRVLGSGFWVQGFWVQGSKVQGSKVQGSGFRVQRFKGSGVQGSRFRGSGFKVQGSALPLATERPVISKEKL